MRLFKTRWKYFLIGHQNVNIAALPSHRGRVNKFLVCLPWETDTRSCVIRGSNVAIKPRMWSDLWTRRDHYFSLRRRRAIEIDCWEMISDEEEEFHYIWKENIATYRGWRSCRVNIVETGKLRFMRKEKMQKYFVVLATINFYSREYHKE